MRTFWFWPPHPVISGVGWLLSAEGLKPLGGTSGVRIIHGHGLLGLRCTCGSNRKNAVRTGRIAPAWPAGQTAPVSTEEPGPSVPMKPRRKHAEEVSPGPSVQSPEEVRDWSVTGPDARAT